MASDLVSLADRLWADRPSADRLSDDQGRSQSFGIMNHAAAAATTERPAQISMTILNPNTNASPMDSLIAIFIPGFRPAGTCKPPSLISSA